MSFQVSSCFIAVSKALIGYTEIATNLPMLHVSSWSSPLTSKEVNSSCGPMVFWNSPIIRTFNHTLSCRIVPGQFFKPRWKIGLFDSCNKRDRTIIWRLYRSPSPLFVKCTMPNGYPLKSGFTWKTPKRFKSKGCQLQAFFTSCFDRR